MKHLVAVTPVTFTCDVCGAYLAVRCETTRFDGLEEPRAVERALQTAYQAGWWVTEAGVAICPAHYHGGHGI